MAEFWVTNGVEWVDLYPFAEDVLDKAPNPCGMEAQELAGVAQSYYTDGKIYPEQFPSDYDFDDCQMLVIRVARWANWALREVRMKKSGFKHWEIRVEEDACAKMKARDGEIIHINDVKRLPLDDCWQQCHCWYGLHRPNRKR